jgi:DNA-binding MarR family transcriptional regulator
MKTATKSAPSTARAEAIDLVANTLMHRSSRLQRLLTSFGERELTRTEAGLLVTLLGGPRRITELAESEALAQPTVTKMVDSLQQRGLVARERAETDGRVVFVSISADGQATIGAYRAQVRELMRDTVQELSDDDLAQLAAASDLLARLIETLQQRRTGS